jgi:NADPH:quinone reductase-like Zn-dependent oxidoreductase
MKAIVLEKYGSPDFFELIEVDKPKSKDNEVLVKVFLITYVSKLCPRATRMLE